MSKKDVTWVWVPPLLCVPPFFPFLLWRLLCFLLFCVVFFCLFGFFLLSVVIVVLSVLFGWAVVLSVLGVVLLFLSLGLVALPLILGSALFRWPMLGCCVVSSGVKFLPALPSLPSGGGGLFFFATKGGLNGRAYQISNRTH